MTPAARTGQERPRTASPKVSETQAGHMLGMTALVLWLQQMLSQQRHVLSKGRWHERDFFSCFNKDGRAKGWEETPSPPTARGAQARLMAPWQHSRMRRIQHGCLQAALRDS